MPSVLNVVKNEPLIQDYGWIWTRKNKKVSSISPLLVDSGTNKFYVVVIVKFLLKTNKCKKWFFIPLLHSNNVGLVLFYLHDKKFEFEKSENIVCQKISEFVSMLLLLLLLFVYFVSFPKFSYFLKVWIFKNGQKLNTLSYFPPSKIKSKLSWKRKQLSA